MITNDLAKTKWCPFAMVQSETKECDIEGFWIDTIVPLVAIKDYQVKGKIIAVASINRNADGTAHEDCLCLTTGCVFWRDFGGGQGDCSKLNDNMNERFDTDDAGMKEKWCPHARPENETVEAEWVGDIEGCANAVSGANRSAGNVAHPASKCITIKCMAYTTDGASIGYCMHSDKNMQR